MENTHRTRPSISNLASSERFRQNVITGGLSLVTAFLAILFTLVTENFNFNILLTPTPYITAFMSILVTLTVRFNTYQHVMAGLKRDNIEYKQSVKEISNKKRFIFNQKKVQRFKTYLKDYNKQRQKLVDQEQKELTQLTGKKQNKIIVRPITANEVLNNASYDKYKPGQSALHQRETRIIMSKHSITLVTSLLFIFISTLTMTDEFVMLRVLRLALFAFNGTITAIVVMIATHSIFNAVTIAKLDESIAIIDSFMVHIKLKYEKPTVNIAEPSQQQTLQVAKGNDTAQSETSLKTPETQPLVFEDAEVETLK